VYRLLSWTDFNILSSTEKSSIPENTIPFLASLVGHILLVEHVIILLNSHSCFLELNMLFLLQNMLDYSRITSDYYRILQTIPDTSDYTRLPQILSELLEMLGRQGNLYFGSKILKLICSIGLAGSIYSVDAE
jgi:hypothetical protein